MWSVSEVGDISASCTSHSSHNVVSFVNVLPDRGLTTFHKSGSGNQYWKYGRNAADAFKRETPLAVNAKQNASSLENAVDKVATDGSTGTEDGRITQLLAELLTVLRDLARSLAFAITHT